MKMSLKCFMFRSLKTLQVDLIFKIKVKALSRVCQAGLGREPASCRALGGGEAININSY